jgi:hypothetical protein
MKNDGIRGTEKRRVSGVLFKREMLNFIKYNPTFGRKNINPVKRTRASFVSSTAAQCTRPVQEAQQLSGPTNENVVQPNSVAPGLTSPHRGVGGSFGTPRPTPKTVVFNTANPGLTISKIEKMYRNYRTIVARNINEYDSESSYDSDDEIERQSYARSLSTQEDIDSNRNPFLNILERIDNRNNIINTGRGENRTDQELELEEGEIAENDSIS